MKYLHKKIQRKNLHLPSKKIFFFFLPSKNFFFFSSPETFLSTHNIKIPSLLLLHSILLLSNIPEFSQNFPAVENFPRNFYVVHIIPQKNKFLSAHPSFPGQPTRVLARYPSATIYMPGPGSPCSGKFRQVSEIST
jgi:hypothetical protein